MTPEQQRHIERMHAVEMWEERAAIMQHDGKVSQRRAEWLAYLRVCELCREQPMGRQLSLQTGSSAGRRPLPL